MDFFSIHYFYNKLEALRHPYISIKKKVEFSTSFHCNRPWEAKSQMDEMNEFDYSQVHLPCTWHCTYMCNGKLHLSDAVFTRRVRLNWQNLMNKSEMSALNHVHRVSTTRAMKGVLRSEPKGITWINSVERRKNGSFQ